MKKYLVGLLIIGVVFASFFVGWFSGVASSKGVPISTSVTGDKVLEFVNQYRQQNNLQLLKTNKVLCDLNMARLNYLTENKLWSHDGFDSQAKMYVGPKVGETLARGFDNPGDIVNSWLDSPSHKKELDHSGYSEACATSTGNLVVLNLGQP